MDALARDAGQKPGAAWTCRHVLTRSRSQDWGEDSHTHTGTTPCIHHMHEHRPWMGVGQGEIAALWLDTVSVVKPHLCMELHALALHMNICSQISKSLPVIIIWVRSCLRVFLNTHKHPQWPVIAKCHMPPTGCEPASYSGRPSLKQRIKSSGENLEMESPSLLPFSQ